MIKRELGWAGFVTGRVDAHIRREQTGFVVGTVDVGERPRLKVIGSMLDADLERIVTLGGVIENDERQGGLQFRIAGVLDPTLDEASLRVYLGSGLVRHVGPATAEAILSSFGSDTLRVLTEESERLSEIRGITPALLPETQNSLATTLHLAGIVGLLAPFGISQGICRQAYKRHGSGAAGAIRANPWSLALDYVGVGFPTADVIALRLGHSPDEPERAEAALVHVVGLATRQGHTVVPRETALAEGGKLLRREPAELVEALANLESRAVLATVAEPDGVATPDLARAERRLAQALGGLLARTATWDAAVNEAQVADLEATSGITFDETQREAVNGVLSRGVTVLTGGPGTGKTTIVRAVCDLAEHYGLSVALMSFTGKAAKRLSEATSRPASTIHRYLRFVPGTGFQGPEYPADVVIVDEVSMLDVALADELASRLLAQTRLVLVGDIDQLPSIGAGNVLADLVASAEVPVFRLNTIHRTGEGSGIPELAAAINAGASKLPYDGTTTHFVHGADQSAIAAWVRAFFVARRGRADEYQVLAPMKAGTAGVDNLNGVIANVLRGPAEARGRPIVREAYDMCAGDRIIWTVNDKELGLFNGEIGTLVEVRSNGSALVEFMDQSFLVVSEKVAANYFSLAYALTVHKAQGSEFPTVIVVQDNGAYHMLARRLLYTAVSRARQNAVIIGQAAAVAQAVRHHDTGHRRTALAPLLRAAVASATASKPSGALSYDPDAPF